MSSRLIQLNVRNFLGIDAVQIEPDGNLVVLNGPNGAGKTSVLTAIWALLASKAGLKNIDQPVHNGKGTAVIEGVIDLGDGETLRITRSFTAAGGMNIKVMAGDGSMAVRSPETALKKLFTSISFDPLAFSKMRGKEQVEVYLRAVDTELDLDELNVKRAQIFDERTEINREVSTVTATLQGLPESTASADDDEVSGASIMDERDAAQEIINARSRAETFIMAQQSREEAAEALIAELRPRLDRAIAERDDAQVKRREARDSLEAMPPTPDLTGFAERLTEIEETNRQIRLAKQRRALEESATANETEARKLTDALDKIDADKRAVIAKVPQIVPGLTFDEEGMIFNGVPLAQASGSERLLVSCQVGMALNPTVRVMTVQDGPLLDTASMEMLERLAEEKDFTVWIERQLGTDAEGVGFTISEGKVIARPASSREPDITSHINSADTDYAEILADFGPDSETYSAEEIAEMDEHAGRPLDLADQAVIDATRHPDEVEDEAAVDAFFEALGTDGGGIVEGSDEYNSIVFAAITDPAGTIASLDPEAEPPADDAPPIWEANDGEF
jgi:energy-coupling factor transporter ATP-binding protein EcfA2